jgi:hypothetical protein
MHFQIFFSLKNSVLIEFTIATNAYMTGITYKSNLHQTLYWESYTYGCNNMFDLEAEKAIGKACFGSKDSSWSTIL